MKNAEIASLFERIADVLELKGENTFRINSYRRAARVINDLTEDIKEIADKGKLKDIPGIGEGHAAKIDEYLKTGHMTKYDEVMKGISEETVALMQISGLGPKTVAMLNKELGIVGIADLEEAIHKGKLQGLRGLAEKKIENILKGIELYRTSQQRIPLGVAFPVVNRIVARLGKTKGIKAIQAAGSLRRMKETIGDIDILTAGTNGKEIIQAFVSLPEVTQVLAAGDTKGSIRIEEGLQVDLRVVEEDSFGSALQYFTGSKAHNIHLREIAKKKGLKISEYGIFKGNKKLGGAKEEDIYETLGMKWIPPELREDRGEIAASQEDRLPRLVEPKDIRGDLHVHSKWTDGSSSFEEIAQRAQSRGYEYCVVSDHTKSTRVAHGLDEERLLKEIEEIDKINKKLSGSGLRLLKASECDIRTDGKMDMPDEILSKLDIVLAAVHAGFKQSKEQITERILAAIENPYVNILVHPTGRLISQREAYEVDMDKVMEAAARTGTAMEINSYFDRLDLNDVNARKAKEMGVKVAISTDTHHLDQMWMIELGVGIARRGWLEKEDVINTWPLKKLLEFCQAKRKKLAGKR
ncbi:MAG TPA: DNA polymerase/3'-5' exonuclease PolX [Candidatus Hypogeohydataceae bacterium YC38]